MSRYVFECIFTLVGDAGSVRCRDRFGFTPLEDAMRHEHAEAQQILVGRDAYLEGMTLACRLCEHASVGDVDQVKMLMSCGADPNVRLVPCSALLFDSAVPSVSLMFLAWSVAPRSQRDRNLDEVET